MTSADHLSYVNPVIDADYSDPDAIRVGDTYWMTASSFHRVPGLPILRSHDLVTWDHVGNALPAIPPTEHFALPRHGGGAWAPSLRHRDGVFYLVFPDPDHGIWVTQTGDPAGAWSAPRLLLPGVGRIDPCPLWDDDGRAYLVHGWAASRAGFKNRLSMVEVDPTLTRVIGPEAVVVDGDALPGYGTLEGPKLYKRDGWYWIFAPAGGVATGWQTVLRSRSPWGPYEDRIVLEQGDGPVNGPHQGAWVDTPFGEHWFLHFSDRGPLGRLVYLQPMTWGDDGWPTMGTPGRNGIGQAVASHPSPAGTRSPQPALRLPAADDEFDGPLGPQWYWQANPEPNWASMSGGHLRLRPLSMDTGDLRMLPNVLSRRIPGQAVLIDTVMRVPDASPDGWRAGLAALGSTYSWIGVRKEAGVFRVVASAFEDAALGERPLCPARSVEPGSWLRLRLTSTDGTASWLYGAGDGDWVEAGCAPLAAGQWVGADIGLFATQPVGVTDERCDGVFEPLRIDLVHA